MSVTDLRTQQYVSAMELHWQKCGNVSSPALRTIWAALHDTLTEQIARYGTPQGKTWRVFPAELGVGKTEGLKVYCARLPREHHPGVLVVVRLRRQTEDFAEDVNAWAGDGTASDTAFAYHSDLPEVADLKSLPDYPVLVITHAALERSLEHLCKDEYDPKWRYFLGYGQGRRKLVVVDEALDFVGEEHCTSRALRYLLVDIPEHIARAFPAQISCIEGTIAFLAGMDDWSIKTRVAFPMALEKVLGAGRADFTGLLQALKTNTKGWSHYHRRMERGERTKGFHDVLSALVRIREQWAFAYSKKGEKTLTTAWLKIPPEEAIGPVMLDATAPRNLEYRLAHEKFDVVPVPSARRYENVVLYVAETSPTGKSAMEEHAAEIIQASLAGIADHYGESAEERRVLVITHEIAEAAVLKYTSRSGFKELAVAHWNALDGLNTWREFDTVLVLSMPFRDDSSEANAFQALLGPQTTAWLNDSALRSWSDAAGRYDDVLRALKVSRLVVNIGQGINRVRCRRVVDALGNCERTDVWLRLPARGPHHGLLGQDILAGLLAVMPGARVVEWKLDQIDGRKLEATYSQALVALAKAMEPGRVHAGEVRRRLRAPKQRWQKIVAQLHVGANDQQPGSTLAGALLRQGVRYESSGTKGQAWFVKEPVKEP